MSNNVVARRIVPIDGVVIDTTVTPMEFNCYLHGIKISFPVDDDLHKLLQERPCEFRLEVVVTR